MTVQAAAESTVFLDGKRQGLTDAGGEFVLELNEGEHVVMVTRPDLLMQSQRFTVAAGQSERVVFGGKLRRRRIRPMMSVRAGGMNSRARRECSGAVSASSRCSSPSLF